MTDIDKIVKIFTMPQEFPCGQESSCCGPVGQANEEIQGLKNAIEEGTGCQVEVLNTTKGEDMKKHLNVVRLLHSFGPTALPIITLNDEVVSMGNSKPKEAVLAVQEKIKSV